MKRRTLDIIFASVGAILAVLMLVLGLVLTSQYNWGQDYVKDELGSQKITFTSADRLTDEEKTWKPGSSCLVENAGKLLETGKQAECYAKYYIGLHLDEAARNATVDGKNMGWEGQTYATLGGVQSDLRAKIAAANQSGDTQTAATLQKQLDAATSLRSTLQTGETLRGLLLTSYGFSIFGDKALLVANISYGIAALLALLSIAGFIHAWRAKDSRVFEEHRRENRPGNQVTAS